MKHFKKIGLVSGGYLNILAVRLSREVGSKAVFLKGSWAFGGLW